MQRRTRAYLHAPPPPRPALTASTALTGPRSPPDPAHRTNPVRHRPRTARPGTRPALTACPSAACHARTPSPLPGRQRPAHPSPSHPAAAHCPRPVPPAHLRPHRHISPTPALAHRAGFAGPGLPHPASLLPARSAAVPRRSPAPHRAGSCRAPCPAAAPAPHPSSPAPASPQGAPRPLPPCRACQGGHPPVPCRLVPAVQGLPPPWLAGRLPGPDRRPDSQAAAANPRPPDQRVTRPVRRGLARVVRALSPPPQRHDLPASASRTGARSLGPPAPASKAGAEPGWVEAVGRVTPELVG